MCHVRAIKDRRGHLVEWVEKSSFARLNKLFEINQSEQNHSVLLIEKNLRVVLAQAKPFVIPFLPWLARLILVLGWHFVLKDLPFYKVARLADAKARQSHLNAREKKRKKGTLRQAPSSTSRVTSSLASWPTKKKTIVRPQAQETSIEPDEAFRAKQIEWYETIEPVVPHIIEETKEEEMATNI